MWRGGAVGAECKGAGVLELAPGMAPQFVSPTDQRAPNWCRCASRRTAEPSDGRWGSGGPSDEQEEANDWGWITATGRKVDKPPVLARR